MSDILPADSVVRILRKSAKRPSIEDYFEHARRRRELRQPPGKGDSLGDAINWETLLGEVPSFEDVHLVTADSDFASPLRKGILHDYLADEWSKKKHGTARLYTDLSGLLVQHFAAVHVPSDIPKVRLIQKLATTESFDATHRIVEQLQQYDVFTPEQANLIVTHAVRNSQIRWIASDEDVRALLTWIIDSHRRALDSSMVAILERCMNGDEPAFSTILLNGEIW